MVIKRLNDSKGSFDDVSPFNTCIYLLLIEIEKVRTRTKITINNGQRAYLSFALWTLIKSKPVPVQMLKAYILVYFDDVSSLVDAFLSSLRHHAKHELVANADASIFKAAEGATDLFLRQLSLIGNFVRAYDAAYERLSEEQHFESRRRWLQYLNEAPSSNEIARLATLWQLDVQTAVRNVEERESRLDSDGGRNFVRTPAPSTSEQTI